MTSTLVRRLLNPIGLGCLMAVAAASVTAQEAGQVYGGLSVGQARAKVGQTSITAGLRDAGLSTTSMTVDERDLAYKLFGGYQIDRHFALEAGYFNLGRFGFTSTTQPAGTLDGQIKLRGYQLDLVGNIRLGRGLSVFGRVGAQYARARDRFSATGAVTVANPNPRRNLLNPKVGLGLQFAASPAILMRAEVERYRIDDAVGNRGDINVASFSLVFPFGGPPARMAASAPGVSVAAAQAAAEGRR